LLGDRVRCYRSGVATPRLLLVSLVFAALGGTAEVRASGPDDLTQQQMDYAKQLYEQGVAAMEAKDYDEALRLFGEAYRYAPQLHLFNFNIGNAAELAGNCQRARTAFKMFLDLVPDHPERGTVQKKLDVLEHECPYDVESGETVSIEARGKRDVDRAEQAAERSMQAALDELRKSISLYEKTVAQHPGATVVKRVLAKKRRHEKRMVKLLSSYDVEVPAAREFDGTIPEDLKQACAKAASQEKKNASAFEAVIEHFDSREIWRVMNRFLKHAERRDRPRFEGCS
jgi:tetratricopeptide (TPR) repeat protein